MGLLEGCFGTFTLAPICLSNSIVICAEMINHVLMPTLGKVRASTQINQGTNSVYCDTLVSTHGFRIGNKSCYSAFDEELAYAIFSQG
ncbi:hypothetical protein VNO77_23242 [Canavalia gladiata]|uniref:Uncharacterized protein n=1 Tax=Canavalia gladiata TaxID=3824 RepID=A0AAN9L5J2_CANGL